MTLMQLKSLCEVCKRDSMSKAAERLFVPQPAISSAIKKPVGELAAKPVQHPPLSGMISSSFRERLELYR